MMRFAPPAVFVLITIAANFGVPSRCLGQWPSWERFGWERPLWEVGRAPAGGVRYRGPLLNIAISGSSAAAPPADAGLPPQYPAFGIDAPAPTPSWHDHQPWTAARDRERFYYDLDRMHRFRTREERYADDFRDRYAAGDPYYRYQRPPVHHERLLPPTRSTVPGTYASAYGNERIFVADAELGDLLRASSIRLTNSLSRMEDGGVWMNRLRPDRIVQSIDRAEFPGTLADLVGEYETVARNPRLVLIAESTGFRDTRRMLAQYVHLQSRFGDVPDEFESEIEGPVIQSAPSGVSVGNDFDLGAGFPDAETSVESFRIEVQPALNAPRSSEDSSAETDEVEIQMLPPPAGEPDTRQ